MRRIPSIALAELAGRRYDLIFLDVNMPGMDGFELCKQIRALAIHATTPIVFLTGLATLENRVQSSLCGGNDFIAKPFNLHELSVKAITLILKGAAPARVGSAAVLMRRSHADAGRRYRVTLGAMSVTRRRRRSPSHPTPAMPYTGIVLAILAFHAAAFLILLGHWVVAAGHVPAGHASLRRREYDRRPIRATLLGVCDLRPALPPPAQQRQDSATAAVRLLVIVAGFAALLIALHRQRRPRAAHRAQSLR